MKKLPLLFSLLLTFPVFARVISYAPYTNRTATPGYHDRTSRYFVLVERFEDNFYPQSQVVLYDSTGVEEPRVIYPQSGTTNVAFAALYEPKVQILPIPPPRNLCILVGELGKLMLSTDSGTTWKEVTGVKEYSTPFEPRDVDIGGPFVRGLATQVMSGTDQYPFVIKHGLYVSVINSLGVGKSLFGPPQFQPPLGQGPLRTNLAGRNAAGDKILIEQNFIIKILDLDTQDVKIVGSAPFASYYDTYSGWITSDDKVYLQVLHAEGRFLYYDGQFVIGPYDLPPPTPTVPPRYLDTMAFLAVPTHDFNGAWMIQRNTGKPTTLSHHTPSGGVETMWTDVSGPQVEALIAGAAGDKVLVQVHRPRNVALERPFVDPALAVWHVGQPAPRAYDELYLNESWSKGFVHVDVDRLEAGEPFVFNSGFQETLPDIIISPAPPGGGADVIQEWGVVRASLKQRLVFPGVARLRGAFDSFWLTDVTLYNPFAEEQDVEIQYVALGGAVQSSAIAPKTITLQPGEIRNVVDALKSLFGLDSGGGALHFLPEHGINVTGRTYTRRPDGGTLGFNMQAIDFYNAAGPRFPMTFSGAFPGEHFRTNLLLTDTSGRGSAASVNAFGLTGAMGQTGFVLEIFADSITQYNGLDRPLGILSRDAGGLIVQPTRGSVIPTVVAIDNRTNDPTYFPPDIPASIPRIIPVIGHLDGAHGSHFRSDLYLLNPSGEARTLILEAKAWDSTQRKNLQFTLLPHEARVIPDVLSTMFGMTGLARLHYQTREAVEGSGEGVRATSRTYTIEESGATYGCLVPPLNNFQIAAPGDRLEILGVNASADFRVNLGLVELTRNMFNSDANVRVSILDETSKTIDTFTVTVPRTGGMQINDIFGARGLTPPNAAMIVVENLGGSPGGLIGAYATLTDNKTNDSTFLGAQLGAQP